MLTPMECEKLLGLEHSSADAPETFEVFWAAASWGRS